MKATKVDAAEKLVEMGAFKEITQCVLSNEHVAT